MPRLQGREAFVGCEATIGIAGESQGPSLASRLLQKATSTTSSSPAEDLPALCCGRPVMGERWSPSRPNLKSGFDKVRPVRQPVKDGLAVERAEGAVAVLEDRRLVRAE